MDLSHLDIVDPRFAELVLTEARLEMLYAGVRFGEGPAWFGGGRYLLWSDIPHDRILRWDETSGAVSTFRQPAHNANGNTVDTIGRLVTCEHLTRRVTRTEHDGTISVLAERFDGKRLNSPCDAVVKSDGSIWFSDADYGIRTDWEGQIAALEIGRSNVYRIDPVTLEVTLVANDLEQPNGLAFSPDERQLYVVDSGVTHRPDGPRELRVYDVAAGGTALGAARAFAQCDDGFFDGVRVDERGHVWVSAGDGVHCFHPDGTLLGRILVPDGSANLAFGSVRRNRLFLCGPERLWSIFVNTRGLRYATRHAVPEA